MLKLELISPKYALPAKQEQGFINKLLGPKDKPQTDTFERQSIDNHMVFLIPHTAKQ